MYAPINQIVMCKINPPRTFKLYNETAETNYLHDYPNKTQIK